MEEILGIVIRKGTPYLEDSPLSSTGERMLFHKLGFLNILYGNGTGNLLGATDPRVENMLQAKHAHPGVSMIAVFNNANGAGTSTDKRMLEAIQALKSAGINTLGYVYTGEMIQNPWGYTSGFRLLSGPDSVDGQHDNGRGVYQAIDAWSSYYSGELTGIYFDNGPGSNQPTSQFPVGSLDAPANGYNLSPNGGTQLQYYKACKLYALSKGYTLTMGNAGGVIPENWQGVLDVINIWETNGLPTSLPHSLFPGHWAIQPYSVPACPSVEYLKSIVPSVKYVFCSNLAGGDTWPGAYQYDSEYLQQLVTNISKV